MISIRSRDLGLQPLSVVWADMKRFTDAREAKTRDEVWFLEHPPVFTLGLNADRAHLLTPGTIPVWQIDRGGQVTYHGPGELVIYTLIDLRRLKISVRGLVEALEAAVIDTVAGYGIDAYGQRDAPGVYVDGKKLAAVGLRVRRYCSYHGVAVNVNMDLAPFAKINPCGFEGLEVTQLSQLSDVSELATVRQDIEPNLRSRMNCFSVTA